MAPRAHTVTARIAGEELTLETGRIARQASGAVVARRGDDVVLATVVVTGAPRPGADFFPLMVEYREKLAAAGRIPGSFQRREGRITDHEVLVSRLIDRTLRSLFPDGYRNDVQIQVTVLSAAPERDVASLGLIAACAALRLSPAPASGPAGGLRLARADGKWIPWPSDVQRAGADVDFVVSAGPDGLVMVEGAARETPETDCLAALEQALEWIGKLHAAVEELRTAAGREPDDPPAPTEWPGLPDAVRQRLAEATAIAGKRERREAIRAVEQEHLASLGPEEDPAPHAAALAAERSRQVRERILAEGHRPDGRGPEDIRPIWCEVGWLPRAHGSAIFTRGETQALVSCTLASVDSAQRLEGLSGSRTDPFLLHYNFPPYSVGEVRPLRGPGRREIGHGFLARRGLLPLLPDEETFPYTVRLESEISESNGSSSMATVCGGSLALMHAGVPVAGPAAGIAMGLVTDGSRTAVLSDILGDEDHLGDMDFKVVGTRTGVTALQLDNKIGGLSFETLARAVEQAREGRLHILGEMEKTLDAPSPELSPFAPQVQRTAIMPSSIGVLVGPRGANIRAIQEETGADISITDDGAVLVYAPDKHGSARAMARVRQSAGVLKVGRCYRGTVTGVRDFGAFVRVNGVNEGLVPVEELDRERVRSPHDITAEGDEMIVEVLGADERGRLRLSRARALGVDETEIEF